MPNRLKAVIAACALFFLAGAWEGPLRAAEEPSPPVYDMAIQEAWIPMPDGVRLSADLTACGTIAPD